MYVCIYVFMCVCTTIIFVSMYACISGKFLHATFLQTLVYW